ncbi:MAG: hypothetical protein H8E27_07810 [Verrucomicrobia subdivision 3 bacterium]|nr:hypothetical protein [Limisphaerales bacterium]
MKRILYILFGFSLITSQGVQSLQAQDGSSHYGDFFTSYMPWLTEEEAFEIEPAFQYIETFWAFKGEYPQPVYSDSGEPTLGSEYPEIAQLDFGECNHFLDVIFNESDFDDGYGAGDEAYDSVATLLSDLDSYNDPYRSFFDLLNTTDYHIEAQTEISNENTEPQEQQKTSEQQTEFQIAGDSDVTENYKMAAVSPADVKKWLEAQAKAKAAKLQKKVIDAYIHKILLPDLRVKLGPKNIDNPTAFELGWLYALGTGNARKHWDFYDGHKMTEDLRRSRKIRSIVELAKEKLSTECIGYKFDPEISLLTLGMDGVRTAKGTFRKDLGGWDGPIIFLNDYSVFIIGDKLGGNKTSTFLGTYAGNWEAIGHCWPRVGGVQIIAKNDSSLVSATRFPVIGYADRIVGGRNVASVYELILNRS